MKSGYEGIVDNKLLVDVPATDDCAARVTKELPTSHEDRLSWWMLPTRRDKPKPRLNCCLRDILLRIHAGTVDTVQQAGQGRRQDAGAH